MRKFQRPEGPGRDRRARELSIIVVSAMVVACSLDKIPDELRPAVEPRIPFAVSLAESSAALCAAVKEGGSAKTPGTTSPAVGTALATDLAVVEILVRCVWAGDAEGDSSSSHIAGLLFDFPPLRAANRRERGAPATLVYDTRVRPGDPAYERVHVPSMYSELAGSADITAIEPIPSGGSVEVTVAVKR